MNSTESRLHQDHQQASTRENVSSCVLEMSVLSVLESVLSLCLFNPSSSSILFPSVSLLYASAFSLVPSKPSQDVPGCARISGQATCPHARCDCRRELQHSTRSSGGKKFDGRECRAETSLQCIAMQWQNDTQIRDTYKYRYFNQDMNTWKHLDLLWFGETLRQKHCETLWNTVKHLTISHILPRRFSGLRICIGPTPEVHQGGEKRPTEDDQKRHHDRQVPCSRKVPGPNAKRSQHAADLKSTKGCYSDLIV